MKRIIDYQQRKVEGTVVPFDVMSEGWGEYRLNDGSTLKLKAVLVEVVRLDGEFNELGDPAYHVRSQNIVVASSVPDHLRKNQGEG